jgi:hypothetical protein
VAWTTPRTWTTGETVTAAIMNAHVRDDLSYLYGAPSCGLARAATQSIATSVASPTAVTFTATEWDTGVATSGTTMSGVGSNPTRITARVAGVYTITASGTFDAMGAANTVDARIRVNGGTSYGPARYAPAGGANSIGVVALAQLLLAVGDYLEMMVSHNQGAAVNISVARMAATFVSAGA